MDIRFRCPACEHHMVIDQAGAGLFVDCPECGRQVCVPTAPDSKPKPSAEPTKMPLPEKEKTVALKWTPPAEKTRPEPGK